MQKHIFSNLPSLVPSHDAPQHQILELQITTDLSGHTDLANQQKVGKMRCTAT